MTNKQQTKEIPARIRHYLDLEDVEGHRVSVNPWGGVLPDFKKESGGDWYLMCLSAALGYKAVHGANTAPSTEVLCKASQYDDAYASHGFIKWDDSVNDFPYLGDDISDQHYKHHMYRGSVTTSSNVLAYEDSYWEPTQRKRARTSALLAAGMYAHGKSKEDAIRVVSKITGDVLDSEAVDSAILPASHLKREMTIVSKANHRVFGRGTIQRGIIWQDSNLSLHTQRETMAFDWGRAGAIARYIGEANIQNCTAFRHLAKRFGVPYYIVRNAWAYVSEVDYQLDPADFEEIPDINISKYGIPPLIGSFIGHEQDIMHALTRSSKTLRDAVETDALRGYAKLYTEAKARSKLKRGRTPAVPVTHQREVTMQAHSLDPSNVLSRLAKARVVDIALMKAINARIKLDVELKRNVARYKSANDELDYVKAQEYMDVLVPDVVGKATWILARSLLPQVFLDEQGREADAAVLGDLASQLKRYRSDLLGYPVHLDVEVPISTSMIEKLRFKVSELIAESEGAEMLVSLKQHDLIDFTLKQTTAAFSKLSENAGVALQRIRSEIAPVYYSWFKEVEGFHDRPMLKDAVKFYYAGYAMSHLDIRMCSSRSAGFVDGAAPLKSYVYKCTVKLGKLFGYPIIPLRRLTYLGAIEIASELALSPNIPFNVVECVRYVTKILDKAVGDLMLGEVNLPDREELQEFINSYDMPDSPKYGGNIMAEAEAEAAIEAMMLALDAERLRNRMSPYEECLNTYPSTSLADKYAKANGYQNFDDAFAELGIACSYYDQNEYCMKARGVILDERMAQWEQEEEDDGYAPII